MSSIKTFTLFLTLCTVTIQAQKSHITLEGKPYDRIEKSAIQQGFLLDIDRSLFKPKHQKSISEGMITMDLKLGEQIFELQLFEDDLLSPTLINEIISSGQNVPLTYEGYTIKGGRTRLTINEGFIYGFIEDDDISYYIEPAFYNDKRAKIDAYIIYDGEAALELNSMVEERTCGYADPVTKSIKAKVEVITHTSQMACRGLKIAIASDHTMWSTYSGETGVNNHNTGVLNNVQGDYDGTGSGAFDIEFQIVARYNASSAANNPYNTTGADAGAMLNEFRSWSLNGGFGGIATPHIQGGASASGLAVLWSDKNITYGGSSSVVGLANTPGNHSVLEDFGGNNPAGSGYGLRVLTSHEMGHNLSYGHDNNSSCNGGNCIMWPSVQNTSTWSPASITAINNNLNGRGLTGCFASCTNNIQDLGELGVDCGGVCDPCPCTANDTYESPLNLTIQLDNYAEESSWDIRTSGGTLLHSASYTVADRGQIKTINNLIVEDGNGISFNFYDTYGDGICCGFGNGGFTIRDANNTTIYSGGQFTASTSAVFCIEDNTCENEIRDAGEQGIDCGGDCTPCIIGCTDNNAHNYDSNAQLDDGSCLTCSDGLLNGDEELIDCGGSKCAPCITGCTDSNAHNYNPNADISNNLLCETCSDGKQNGDESGLDCGGEKCTPCACTTTDVVSGQELSSNVSIYASNTIISSDTVMSSNSVIFVAGQSIVLNSGFEVEISGIFTAQTEACNN